MGGQMDIPSRYVVDRKVSIYLLVYVLLKDKMSEVQQEVIGPMEEMDAELHNLAKLVLPGYASQWPKMARLQLPHLAAALKERFPDIADLTVKHLLGAEKFRQWLPAQVERFGEWLEIKPIK